MNTVAAMVTEADILGAMDDELVVPAKLAEHHGWNSMRVADLMHAMANKGRLVRAGVGYRLADESHDGEADPPGNGTGKRYDAAFRARALALARDTTVHGAAREMGVSLSRLKAWRAVEARTETNAEDAAPPGDAARPGKYHKYDAAFIRNALAQAIELGPSQASRNTGVALSQLQKWRKAARETNNATSEKKASNQETKPEVGESNGAATETAAPAHTVSKVFSREEDLSLHERMRHAVQGRRERLVEVIHDKQGVKHDEGLPQISRGLLHQFPNACNAIARCSAHGALKYTWDNWLTVDPQRYLDAAGRHLLAAGAELFDVESGELHLIHAAWNLIAAAELQLRERSP